MSSHHTASQQMPRNNFFLFLILGSIGLLTPFAIDMYLPALPSIGLDFGVDESYVKITVPAYTAGFACGQLLYGPLADSFGRRPIMLGGHIFFFITSLLCAVVTSADALVAMRVLQGFAGAASAVVVQAVVRDLFNKEEFSRAMSFITLVITVSPLMAPVIGGHLYVWFGWRSIFITLAIITVLISVAVFFKIPETLAPENKQPLRFRGTIRSYAQLISNPTCLGLIMCGAFAFSGMFSFITVGSFVYQKTFGVDAEHFGYYFAINVIGMIVMTTFNSRSVRKLGTPWMLRFGLWCQLVASTGLILCWLLHLPLWCVVICMILFMGTITLIGSNSLALLLSGYPSMAGSAASMAGTLRFGVSGVVGAIVAVLPSSLAVMVMTMATCSILASVFYWLLGRKAD